MDQPQGSTQATAMNRTYHSSMYASDEPHFSNTMQRYASSSVSSSISPSSSARPCHATTCAASGNDRVKAVLDEKARTIQQLGFKTILKAWIKAICPKKQAKFPYKEHNGKIPGWWPSSGCRYLEPDHINKTERMLLCLHLLTLRPSPAQLEAWNHGSPAHPTLVKQGWTAFLKEHAGSSIFDNENGIDDKRTLDRKRMLDELYQVAAEVESGVSHTSGGNDDLVSRKRSRDPSPEPNACSYPKRIRYTPAYDSPIAVQETVSFSAKSEPFYPSQRITYRPQAQFEHSRERAASLSIIDSGLPQSSLQLPTSYSHAAQRHSISYHPKQYLMQQPVMPVTLQSNGLASSSNMIWQTQAQQQQQGTWQFPSAYTVMSSLQSQDAGLSYPALSTEAPPAYDSFTQAPASNSSSWEQTPREPSLTPSSVYSQLTTACVSPRRTSLSYPQQYTHQPTLSFDSPSPAGMPIGIDSKPLALTQNFESPMISNAWLEQSGQQQELPSASMMEQSGDYEHLYASVEDEQTVGSWQDVYYGAGHV